MKRFAVKPRFVYSFAESENCANVLWTNSEYQTMQGRGGDAIECSREKLPWVSPRFVQMKASLTESGRGKGQPTSAELYNVDNGTYVAQAS